MSATKINRNKYYLDPLIEILWNKHFIYLGLNFIYIKSSIMVANKFLKITVSLQNVHLLWEDLDKICFY